MEAEGDGGLLEALIFTPRIFPALDRASTGRPHGFPGSLVLWLYTRKRPAHGRLVT